MEKTNVMRLLSQKKIPFEAFQIETREALSGTEAAERLGMDPAGVFKTLVTIGHSGAHYVFVIPAGRELDLKKAAAASGEKSVEMLKAKDLLPLTGYVHGGCSPIGMKKPLATWIDRSAEGLGQILFSAGKIGFHVRVSTEELKRILTYQFADLCREEN
jgi:Cys-tRNA(Pro)/Cys-tRNA(Cys) deacylase